MSFSAGLFLVLAFTFNAAANIIFKIASRQGAMSGELSLVTLWQQYWLAGVGLVCFGLNAIFYFFALRYLPLSIAYPTMVVASLVLVGIIAVTVLAERLTVVQIIGYAIIMIGLLVIFVFSPRS